MKKILLFTLLLGMGCSVMHPVSPKTTIPPTPNTAIALDNLAVSVTPSSSVLIASPNASIKFVGTAKSDTNAKITTWTWNFGDGIICTSSNLCGMTISHLFPRTGLYIVRFTATDATGATESVSSIVNVVSPVNCGPPKYSCAYTGVDVVQTPSAPFSSASPVNTKVRESILSHAHLVRLTDQNIGNGLCGKNDQFNAAPNGGDNESITNTNTTMFTVACAGGTRYAFGYNPVTMQMYPATGPLPANDACTGQTAWSKVNSLFWYCKASYNTLTPLGKANGTTIYKLTFNSTGNGLCGLSTCPDLSTAPTWSVVYDFKSCSQAPGGFPTSYSILSVGPGDSYFTQNISWSGGQGTAHLFFEYVPGSGCRTFDSQGDGVHPVWYDFNGKATTITSVTATWGIHDSFSVGQYAQISTTGCVGTSCGTNDGAPVWQMGTSTLIMYGTLPNMGGHDTLSPGYYINMSNPVFNRSALQNPTVSISVAALACSPCQENHFGADPLSDVNPIIGTSAGPNAIWTTPYKNEAYGFTTDTSTTVFRFFKTYISGNCKTTSFEGCYAIGNNSQDRCTYFFTSDMLGTLGTTPAGLNRWDVFAGGLCGQ